jgi:hypothetical protein
MVAVYFGQGRRFRNTIKVRMTADYRSSPAECRMQE